MKSDEKLLLGVREKLLLMFKSLPLATTHPDVFTQIGGALEDVALLLSKPHLQIDSL